MNCSLLHLRWATQNTQILGSMALRCTEACEITLHSMQSTMLACAAQLRLPKEHRMSQGHHRDSALLYSRNDTFSRFLVQSTICTSIADGFRPERSMARGGQAPLPEPPFLHPEPALPAMDLLAGPWVLSTSRHEQLHASSDPQVRLRHKTPDTDAQSTATRPRPFRRHKPTVIRLRSRSSQSTGCTASQLGRRGCRVVGASSLGMQWAMVSIAPRNE